MGAKSREVLQVVSGWEAVELILNCAIYGVWQLFKISFKKLWKGHRRKYRKNNSPVELKVDPSIGTHCYIKIMGVKYHYVEAGPRTGEVVLVLGDAPDSSLLNSAEWPAIIRHLTDTGHRVVTLDLRGSGGSENGSRADLAPPRVVEELQMLLQALGVSEHRPAVVVGQGVGGMLAWYLVHSHGNIVCKFVAIDAPHPSLYWQYPPAAFCQNVLHFLQWPYLPEQWLAAVASSRAGDELRWANSRASDWTGALNYVRGAAWWRIRQQHKVSPPSLLVAHDGAATQLVASAERCAAPTLRLLAADKVYHALADFIVSTDKQAAVEYGARGGLMGRMFGAVAGRGRELSARLLPPLPTAVPA